MVRKLTHTRNFYEIRQGKSRRRIMEKQTDKKPAVIKDGKEQKQTGTL